MMARSTSPRHQIAQVAAGLLADADRDLRIGLAEGGDDRHAEQHARRRRNADGDLAARLACRRRDIVPQRAQLSLEPAQSLLQSPACLGRRHAAPMADDQRRIELPFECVDLPLKVGCDTRSASAALLMFRCSTTARKYSILRLSKVMASRGCRATPRYSIFVSD
jgi:hypothetical protein